MIKLVVFLGNLGAEYKETRHNIGWLLADHLSFFPILDWKNKFKGEYAQYSINNTQIIFLKPHTFMNKSGESVIAIKNFFKLEIENILIVHDEIEFKFGQIGFKHGGGSAGHNGLRSIAQVLGTNQFFRFRLGISRPTHEHVSSYVLGKFTHDEKNFLTAYLSKAAAALEFCLQNTMRAALDNFKKEYVI